MIDSYNRLHYLFLLKGCKNREDCANQCNGHCLDNLPCNSSNGLCSNGCAPGYVGMFCNTSMYINHIFKCLIYNLEILLVVINLILLYL